MTVANKKVEAELLGRDQVAVEFVLGFAVQNSGTPQAMIVDVKIDSASTSGCSLFEDRLLEFCRQIRALSDADRVQLLNPDKSVGTHPPSVALESFYRGLAERAGFETTKSVSTSISRSGALSLSGRADGRRRSRDRGRLSLDFVGGAHHLGRNQLWHLQTRHGTPYRLSLGRPLREATRREFCTDSGRNPVVHSVSVRGFSFALSGESGRWETGLS